MNEWGSDDLRRGSRERERKGEKERRRGKRKFAVDCSDGSEMQHMALDGSACTGVDAGLARCYIT